MKKIPLFLVFLTILLSSCRKDLNKFTSEIDEDPPIVLIENTIRGKVVNELGDPVSNALVRVSGMSVFSAQDGTFRFNKTEVKKSGDIVTATTSEHFEGVSHSNFTAEGSGYIEIRLMEKGVAELFNPTVENVHTQTNGLKVTIPANSIIIPSGADYTGSVKIHARWIDPTDENVGGIMPGALNAVDENGNEKVLATFGMLALNLETVSGGLLLIKPGAEVTAEIPIPNELINDAPEEIPLWEYDLEEGQWLQNGTCNKEGNVYVCKIPKTGYWNCDVPLEAICLSGQVFNADSTFASYVKVIVEDLTDNFIYWGYTDSTGYFCGSVPKGATLKITIKDHCDNIVYMEEIGPYSEDFQLDDIYLDESLPEYFINVTGAISHCLTTDVPEGHLGVRYPGTLKIFPFDNGMFDIDLGLKCLDFPEIELTVYSTSQDESTMTTTINTDTDVSLGLQLTCENLNDSFGLVIDGTSYFTAPTQYYLKPNQTTDWMILEGLSGAGKFILELRDYQGVGQYNDNVFFKTENDVLSPEFYILDSASPDVTINITLDDGEFIAGNYTGFATDSNSVLRNISGDFKIKKAP